MVESTLNSTLWYQLACWKISTLEITFNKVPIGSWIYRFRVDRMSNWRKSMLRWKQYWYQERTSDCFPLFLTDFVDKISCFALLSVARLKTLLQRYDEAKILEPRPLGSFSKPVSMKWCLNDSQQIGQFW